MKKFDIKIMAHPSRVETVENLLEKLKLSTDSVAWDDRPNGGRPLYTAKKAWLSDVPQNITHRLVLQDDIDICENFVKKVSNLIEILPNSIIGLFNHGAECEYKYKKVSYLYGCGIIMPVCEIKKCFDYIKKLENDDGMSGVTEHDDLSIFYYANFNNIPVYTVFPQYVEHLNLPSIANPQ